MNVRLSTQREALLKRRFIDVEQPDRGYVLARKALLRLASDFDHTIQLNKSMQTTSQRRRTQRAALNSRKYSTPGRVH